VQLIETDSVQTIIVVGDAITVSVPQNGSSHSCSVYCDFLSNFNYPVYIAQFLDILQVLYFLQAAVYGTASVARRTSIPLYKRNQLIL